MITAGAYEQVYTYDTIGNITSMNGEAYTYSTKPHAVTAVGAASYIYDGNGNMTNRNGQTITWDVENRPVAIDTESYIYDGDGNRISKTANGETTLYINRYYETNVTTTEETTSYYLGDRLIATRVDDTLSYIHQDSLGSSSVMSDASGQSLSSITYYPFGETRTGSVSTDKKFTGQREDGTGLYYYNARYYDPEVGRFISADVIVQPTIHSEGKTITALTVSVSGPIPHMYESNNKITADNPIKYANPQALNRYSYVFNNPLKYIDPDGCNTYLPTLDYWIFVLLSLMVQNAGGLIIIIVILIIWAILNNVNFEKSTQPDLPAIEYPGDDPSKSPGEDWEWRGNGPPGSGKGSWHNPKTGESLHPDLEHPAPQGPHWDYKDPNGKWWQVWPDGRITPK